MANKHWIRLLGALALGLALAACHTVEGLGKDLKKGGEVIEKTAREAR